MIVVHMKTKLVVRVRHQFKRVDIYPMCETSKILVQLTGKSTFSVQDLELIKKLGFVIDVIPDTF